MVVYGERSEWIIGHCFYSVCIPRCNSYRVVSPLETLPPGDPNGGVVYLRIVLSPEEASRICLCFSKRLSRKSNNVTVFPFPVHIAVQQPFRPLWHACCYTIMNHLEHHLLCASSRYWCRCLFLFYIPWKTEENDEKLILLPWSRQGRR
jgi:hypothetical protein